MNRRTFLAAAIAAPLALRGEAKAQHRIWSKPSRPSLVLRNGPTGKDRRPRPPLRFVEEDMGGSSPKVKVADANGTEWIAKWAEEVHSETFASRMAAAAGYFVRTAYFVPRGKIEGCTNLTRAQGSIGSGGEFESAVFKLIARDEPYLEGHNWGWANNPFLEKPGDMRKLNGLKTMLMLVSNWDAKDARDADRGPNTAIYEVKRASRIEYRYAFDDWGGSMGRWGNVFTRSKWDAKGFEEQTPDFVRGINPRGFLEWGYSGTNSGDVMTGISPADVAWLLGQIGGIGQADIEAGLRDVGAGEEETAVFSRSLRSRLAQLQKAARF